MTTSIRDIVREQLDLTGWSPEDDTVRTWAAEIRTWGPISGPGLTGAFAAARAESEASGRRVNAAQVKHLYFAAMPTPEQPDKTPRWEPPEWTGSPGQVELVDQLGRGKAGAEGWAYLAEVANEETRHPRGRWIYRQWMQAATDGADLEEERRGRRMEVLR